MKKTLSILTAISLVTMSYGATVLTLDSQALVAAGGTYTLPDPVNSGYGNFSVTMALDAQAFQNSILAGNVNTNIFTGNNKIGLGINFISSSSTSGIYGSWDGGAPNRPIVSLEESSTNLSTGLKTLFTSNTYTSAAITYQITGNGTRTYLTLIDSEGMITTLSGKEDGLKAGNFGPLSSFTYGADYVKYLVVDNTVLSAEDSINANLAIINAMVPEPATASLGLLGLAALLMRRRRF